MSTNIVFGLRVCSGAGRPCRSINSRGGRSSDGGVRRLGPWFRGGAAALSNLLQDLRLQTGAGRSHGHTPGHGTEVRVCTLDRTQTHTHTHKRTEEEEEEANKSAVDERATDREDNLISDTQRGEKGDKGEGKEILGRARPVLVSMTTPSCPEKRIPCVARAT